MKVLHKLLPILLLMPILAKGQSNYKPGYMVSLKGDTIKGYVDHREWAQNPRQFSFKKNINESGITYNTSNCSAFGITGLEYYQRAVVTVSEDKINTLSLSTGKDTSSIVDTLFLNIITRGNNVSLYAYTDNIKERFYVSERNTTPVELIRHLYYDRDEASKIVTETGYKGQLRHLAAVYQPGKPGLNSEINNAAYNIEDLRSITNKINGEGNYTQVEVANTGAANFFLGAAITDTKAVFKGNTPFAGNSNMAVFPEIDFGVDLLRNRNVGSLFVRLELGFTGAKFSFTQTPQGSASAISEGFTQYTGYLSPQVGYNFYNTQPLKVYASAGLLINASSFTDKTYDNPSDDTRIYFPEFNSLSLNATLKVGVILNNSFDVHLSYYPPTRLNDDEDYSLKASQFGLGVNYLFGSK